jgi:hypothetical protein
VRLAERLLGETQGLGEPAEGAIRDLQSGLKKLRKLRRLA